MQAARSLNRLTTAQQVIGRSSIRRLPRSQFRFQSTSANGGKSNTHFVSGAAGGIVGAALLYGIYSFTPAGRTASAINKTAIEAHKTYQDTVKKLQDSAPNADDAVDSIKEFAYSYARWIPGGKSYVDAAFKDWETVSKNHKEDTDKIIKDTYGQLQELSKSGLSMETATKAYDILADFSKKVADLSMDSISDVVENHPQLKEKLGGSVTKLQELGDKYGDDAKKQVDETWKQIKELFATGLTAANFDKASKLIEDKVKKLQGLGEETWNKALKEAAPYLDKNPKVKKFIEENADSLKDSNIGQLFDKARKATESGNLDDLKKYAADITEKSKAKGSDIAEQLGLDKYLKSAMDGSEILPKLQQVAAVGKDHKEEGEKLLKETIEEIKALLEDKAKKAKDIAESAKKGVEEGEKKPSKK